MLSPVWHHLQVYQVCLYPPRLQEVTWITGGVLMWFLKSYLDGTFTEGSEKYIIFVLTFCCRQTASVNVGRLLWKKKSQRSELNIPQSIIWFIWRPIFIALIGSITPMPIAPWKISNNTIIILLSMHSYQ